MKAQVLLPKVFNFPFTYNSNIKIKIGDIVKVRQNPITRSLEVINLTERRIGAKLVENFAQDITPKEELEKYHKAIRNRNENKFQGRPSKKERKLINQFMELGGK